MPNGTIIVLFTVAHSLLCLHSLLHLSKFHTGNFYERSSICENFLLKTTHYMVYHSIELNACKGQEKVQLLELKTKAEKCQQCHC